MTRDIPVFIIRGVRIVFRNNNKGILQIPVQKQTLAEEIVAHIYFPKSALLGD